MSISQKLLTKLASSTRTAGLTTNRPDLAISEFHPIGDGSRAGHVVVAYDPHLQPPTAAEVEAFFVHQFGDTVQAQPHTLQNHETVHAVSVLANLQVITRPIQDADSVNMLRVTPLRYLDASTQVVWNVEADEAGRKFMVRESSESLDDVVAARRSRNREVLREARISNTRLATLSLDVGDRVSYYDNGILGYGEITAFDQNMVEITTTTVPVKVQKSAVQKVLQKSEKAMSDDAAKLKKYFTEAFGDAGYSSMLVSGDGDNAPPKNPTTKK